MNLDSNIPESSLTDEISLKTIDFEDPGTIEFLCAVYKSTRYGEMAASGWPAQEIEAFLDQQFRFQHLDYTSKYTEAQYYLVLIDEKESGRLYVDYRTNEIRLMDLALLPEFRGNRVGSTILEMLKIEARKHKKPLTLHVETMNRTRDLYQRLGFEETANDGVYIRMEYHPN